MVYLIHNILDQNYEFVAICNIIEKNYFNKVNEDLDYFLEEKLLQKNITNGKATSKQLY
jgi:hypothetical protein